MRSRLSGTCNPRLSLAMCKSMTVEQLAALRVPGEVGNGREHLEDLDGRNAPALKGQEPGMS